MKVFKENIKHKSKMLTIIFLSLGVILTIFGLILGLKNFDPKYFNAIAGSIIAVITLFGLFGKLFQDISSSNTQQEIKKNTERNLQPFKITALNFTVSYDFDDPKISNTLLKINDIKHQLEDLYSKAPPAVNGKRYLPSTPGFIAFEENNKINNSLIIHEPNFLSNCGYEIPNLTIQISTKSQSENETIHKDGTNTINYDFPVSFELTNFPINEQNKLNRIIVDFQQKKISFNISPIQLNCKRDNGEILSFTDLFGKFLKVSSYHSDWKDNQKKFNIVSLIFYNENKRMQFVFEPEEKSKSEIDLNSAYIHQINEVDFCK